MDRSKPNVYSAFEQPLKIVVQRAFGGRPSFFRQPTGLRAKPDFFNQAASTQEGVHKLGDSKGARGRSEVAETEVTLMHSGRGRSAASYSRLDLGACVPV
jgi:hypothetical protein